MHYVVHIIELLLNDFFNVIICMDHFEILLTEASKHFICGIFMQNIVIYKIIFLTVF